MAVVAGGGGARRGHGPGGQEEETPRRQPEGVGPAAAVVGVGEGEAGEGDVGDDEGADTAHEEAEGGVHGRGAAQQVHDHAEEQQQVADRVGEVEHRGQTLARMVVDGRPDHQVPDAHAGAEDDGEGVEAQFRPVAAAAGGGRERQQRPDAQGVEREVGGVGERRERVLAQHRFVDEPDEVAGPPAAEGDRQSPPRPLDAGVDAGPGRHPVGGDGGHEAEQDGADVAHDSLEAVAAQSGVGRGDQDHGRQHHDERRK